MCEHSEQSDPILFLMEGTVPERKPELAFMWSKYTPTVKVEEDQSGANMRTDGQNIRFDAKTMHALWLIGFNAWNSLVCYADHVNHAPTSGISDAILRNDSDLSVLEMEYKQRRGLAQTLIEAPELDLTNWPSDIPLPQACSQGLNTEETAAFDLTCMATCAFLLHELQHILFIRDDTCPDDRRDEEMACDKFARSFMTDKVNDYALQNGASAEAVLTKRSMALALAAYFLHEITPPEHHIGNKDYFSVADRMKALIENTQLPENSHFWHFAASVLIGIMRQRHTPINLSPMSPKKVAETLLSLV